MTLIDIWFIGMFLLILIQHGMILWLVGKVVAYGQKNLLYSNDDRTYPCNDRNNL